MKMPIAFFAFCGTVGLMAQGAPTTQNAALTVKVPSFAEARDRAITIVEGSGGGIAKELALTNPKGKKHGDLQFRVPSDNLEATLKGLRELGKVVGENLSTTDHSTEIAEYELQSKRWKEHAQRLDSLLTSKRNLRGSDILFLQDRVFRANLSADELLLQRDRVLKGGTQASLVLTLYEPLAIPEAQQGGFAKQLDANWKAAGKSAVTGTMESLVWVTRRLIDLLFWIPVLLIVRHFWKKHDWTTKVKAAFPGPPEAAKAASPPSELP